MHFLIFASSRSTSFLGHDSDIFHLFFISFKPDFLYDAYKKQKGV